MPKEEILVADDDAPVRAIIAQALSRAGYGVRTTGTATTLWRWVESGDGSLIVTGVVMPDGNAFELMTRIKKLRPGLPIIVTSGQNTLTTAIQASEQGAYDYLLKPFDLTELVGLVGRAIAGLKKSREKTAPEKNVGVSLVGRSPAMQEIYRSLARVMHTDLTLLINGEPGTGKDLVSRTLHDHGKRKGGPFVALNMAAIPRDLIERELFGHEEGAFTGANQRLVGGFEQAQNGTLFLHEIGDMPLEAQRRLLRVLQLGEYTTVGGCTPIRTNARIIAATNKDLRFLVQTGFFREDLYLRLNVVPLRLPPLRERLEDIPDLVHHFLQVTTSEGLPQKYIERAALVRMKEYHWPGNVRELENLIRRLAVLHPGEVISERFVQAELDHELSKATSAPPPNGRPMKELENSPTLSTSVDRHLATLFYQWGDRLPPPGLYHRVIREIEIPLLLAALRATNGHQIKAAELLGVNRNTLRKKIRDLGIDPWRKPLPRIS